MNRLSKISVICLTLLLCLTSASSSANSRHVGRFNKLPGLKGFGNGKTVWDKKYSRSSYVYGKSPAKFLAENFDYLPLGGHVLDMGMGEGRNAVFLAGKGFKVTGVDISSVAVRKAKALAKEYKVRIKTIVASLEKYDFRPETFDAIICFYFVDRKLNEKIRKWLKPGGILIYESHTLSQKKLSGYELTKDKYLLKEGELLGLFDDFKMLKYEEPLHKKEFIASGVFKKNVAIKR
ncbi:MAG: class I SAM-dependent methyltransferase [Bacteriovoracaceae bacterium]|jgi:tellurite methyltransferase|nr:class I SAM-dependent methyltransferase [Bacteriovoracaceae bacterium]